MSSVVPIHVRPLPLPLVGSGPAEQFLTTYNGLQVLADGQLVLKGFPFFGNDKIRGWLLLVDPDNLHVNVKNPQLVSSARLTIHQSCNSPTYLYTVNATQSMRYQITDAGFTFDVAWTRKYIIPGSTVASSPLLYGRIGQVAFADNTEARPIPSICSYSRWTSTTYPRRGR